MYYCPMREIETSTQCRRCHWAWSRAEPDDDEDEEDKKHQNDDEDDDVDDEETDDGNSDGYSE